MDNYIHLSFKIIQLLIIIGFLSVFTIRRLNGLKGYIFLNLTLLSALLQGLTETIFFLLERNGILIINHEKFALPIEYFFYGMVFIFLLLHFEYYLGYHFIPTVIGLIFMSIIYSAYFIDLRYDLGYFSFQPVWHMGIGRLWLFLFDCFQLYTLTFCLVASGILFSSARKTSVYFRILFYHIGFFIGFVSAICELLEHFIPNFEPYGGLTFGIAFLIVFLMYLFSPNFVFYSPTHIFQFIVIHKNGQIIYNYTNTLNKQSNNVIIGSVIHAFQMFVEEVTQTRTTQSLEFVKLKDRAIIAYSKYDILGLIITTKYSMLFKNSLEHFVDSFYRQFKEAIQNFTGDLSEFETADELVRKIFPYVVIR